MDSFDYVVVGGGTAGSVVAARLSEDSSVSVCLLEAGPSDVDDPAVLRLDRWMHLLESGYDWDYPVKPQEYGNSFLRHSRARVLGGCASHNSCIAFWAPAEDLDEWVALGADGWSAGAAVVARRARRGRAAPPGGWQPGDGGSAVPPARRRSAGNIDIRVLPFHVGAHPAVAGAFVLLDFPETPG